MRANIEAAKAAYDKIMYKDILTAYRAQISDDGEGTSSSEIPTTPTISDIRCRLSKLNADNARLENNGNFITVRYKIFCGPNVGLNSGDTVHISVGDYAGGILKSYKGIIGEPVKYPTHQEIDYVIQEVS